VGEHEDTRGDESGSGVLAAQGKVDRSELAPGWIRPNRVRSGQAQVRRLLEQGIVRLRSKSLEETMSNKIISHFSPAEKEIKEKKWEEKAKKYETFFCRISRKKL